MCEPFRIHNVDHQAKVWMFISCFNGHTLHYVGGRGGEEFRVRERESEFMGVRGERGRDGTLSCSLNHENKYHNSASMNEY